MKTIINSNELSQNMETQKLPLLNLSGTDEVKIVDYEAIGGKGLFIISLYSQLFFEDRFKVTVHNNRLKIIISEIIEGNSLSMARYDWQNYAKQSYVRMRNISLLLPGDNFYLLRHFLVPEKFLLKIILGHPVEN
ncbi:MAG TPA: hypothetical protein VKA38_08910 [Draconibacterium sp.]|nr:hypothetical protein [Draconibacterium sp.]